MSFYSGDITNKYIANTHDHVGLYTAWSTVLLCSTCTCFVMLLKGPQVCMCVCILATQRATLAGLFWHSIYRLVIWGLSFSLHPKFLCPCATKISFARPCKSPVICTCSFKERPRVSFDSCCLAFIFMRLIFKSVGCVSVGLSINTLSPSHQQYGHKTLFYVSKMLPQIKAEQHTSLFVWVINDIN